MRRTFLLGLAILACLGKPAESQFISDIHLLPTVVHAAGVAPSFWKSDVFVTNYGTYPMTVGFWLFPEGQANTYPASIPSSLTRVVGSRQTIIVEDVVKTLFDLDGMKGALLVTSEATFFPSNAPDAEKIVVMSRTYNSGSDPRGTFGLSVPSSLSYWNMQAVSSWVTGVRNDSKYRCNLGIGSLGPAKITVHFRVRDQAGTEIATGTRSLDGWSMGQWSLSSLGVAQTTGPLSAELWLDPASLRTIDCRNPMGTLAGFYAYVTPVDGAQAGEGTGDGELIFAIPGDSLQLLKLCQ